jgi:hypothetical protein
MNLPEAVARPGGADLTDPRPYSLPRRLRAPVPLGGPGDPQGSDCLTLGEPVGLLHSRQALPPLRRVHHAVGSASPQFIGQTRAAEPDSGAQSQEAVRGEQDRAADPAEPGTSPWRSPRPSA